MLKITIIGSREGIDPQAVIDFVDTLPDDTLVISGGAKGVDTVAIQAAQLRGLETLVYPADWGLYGKGAGMIRNGEIIKDGLDMVAAFWDGKSSGTGDMIERARQAGIPVVRNPKQFVMPMQQRSMF